MAPPLKDILGERDARRATALALLTLVALLIVDITGGDHVVLSGLYVLAPLALALTGARRATAIVAGFAFALALGSGAWNDLLWMQRWFVGLLVTGAGGLIAVLFADRIALARTNVELTTDLSDAERRFEAIVAGLPDAVTVRDDDGRLVYVNDAAVELLGATRDRLTAMGPQDAMDLFDAFDEDGEPIALEDLPGARAWSARTDPEPMVVRNVVRATGAERWLLSKAVAIRDRGGRPRYVVNLTEDITAAKRSELGQRLLAEAGRALAVSLDPQRTLGEVVRMAVPNLADWCAADVPGRDGTVQLVAAAHVDAERVVLARRLRERYPVALDAEDQLAAVLRGELNHWLQDETADAMLVEHAEDAEHLDLMRGLGLNAIMVVPMTAGERVLGAITFVSAQARRFDADDLELACELGRRAGVALENARLYFERGEIAHTLQAALVPDPVSSVPGWDLAALYRPAGDGAEAGGDFYDVIETDDGRLVTIGDVSGKGARAAAITGLARFTMRTAAGITGDAHVALRTLNAGLLRRPGGDLCSAAVVALTEDGPRARARVICAGHPPPLLLRDGEPRPVGRPGLVLGVAEDAAWREVEVPLEPGDRLLLFTDGVTDTAGARGERFGDGRLRAAVDAVRDGHPPELVDGVWDALSRFGQGAQRDDIAVIAIERLLPGEMAFPGGPRAPGEARAAVRERLAEAVAPDLLGPTLLLVSEVVSNAVRHGGRSADGDGRVRLRVVGLAEHVRVEVRDDGDGFEPEMRTGGPDGGFGLVLVERFAARWGVDREPGGVCVWFEQPKAGATRRPEGVAR
jgi:PAS domain S-box-containing protein